MRIFFSILLLITTCFLNAQRPVKINDSGISLTINDISPTTEITVNGTLANPVSKQQINLSWASRGAAKYIVEQATIADFSDAEQIYAGNSLSYAATGLTQNTLYYYRYSWSNDATTNTVFATKNATTLNAGIVYDIDAEAIIEAINTDVALNTGTKVKINNFITSTKANGSWAKKVTWNVGKFASWTANSINWANPNFNDIDGFPEIYSGGVTHNDGKISFVGVGASTELTATRAFSTNWLVPLNYLNQDDKGYTINITDAPTNTSVSDEVIIGATTNSPNVRDLVLLWGLPLGVAKNDELGLSGINVTGTNWMTTNLPGKYVIQRSGSLAANVLVRKNGADILTSLNASTGQPSIPIGTGGSYVNIPVPSPLSYKTYGRDFFASHQSFTTPEMTSWETDVSALLTDLNAETFTPKITTVPTGRFLRFFGDSFTSWPATGATSGEKAWWVRLGQRFKILPITHGQGSTGYFTAINNCYANLETPSLDRIAIFTGYNDVKVYGTDANGIQHGKSGIRAMLVNQFLATATAASDVAVTKTGTWDNPSLASSKSDNIGGNELQSATSGDKISYVFNGDNVVIGVCNSNGSTVVYGSVAITVDAVSQGSYSANNKAYNVTTSGGRIWNAIILKGFGSGSHTVELTLESSVNFVVDYFGTLQDPSLCFPVIIMDIQYDNTGTANRNANADNMTAEIKSMIASDLPEYSSKISYGATNTYYNAADPTQVSGDNVHPQNKGYKNISKAPERVWIY